MMIQLVKTFQEKEIFPFHKAQQCCKLIEQLSIKTNQDEQVSENKNEFSEMQSDQIQKKKIQIKGKQSPLQKQITKITIMNELPESKEERVLLSKIQEIKKPAGHQYIQFTVIGKPDLEFLQNKHVSFIKIKDESDTNQLVMLSIILQNRFFEINDLFKIQCDYKLSNFVISKRQALEGQQMNSEIKITKETVIIPLCTEQPNNRISQLIQQSINHDEEINTVGLILKFIEKNDQKIIAILAFPENEGYNTIQLNLWAEFTNNSINVNQIVYLENLRIKNYNGTLQLSTLKKSQLFQDPKQIPSLSVRQQWDLIQRNQTKWVDQFIKKQMNDKQLDYNIDDLSNIFPPFQNQKYNFIVKIKEILTRSENNITFIVYFNEQYKYTRLTLQGRFPNEHLFKIGNIILLYCIEVQINEGKIEIIGNENVCKIYDLQNSEFLSEQIRNIVAAFQSYEVESFHNIIVHNIEDYQQPFGDVKLNIVVKIKEISFFSVDKVPRKSALVYINSRDDPVNITFFGNLSRNPLIQNGKILLIIFIGLKLYKNQKEIITYDNRTIMHDLSGIQDLPMPIQNKFKELSTLSNSDRASVKIQELKLTEVNLSTFNELQEENKLYNVLVVIKFNNKSFECQNQSNIYQKKILIVSDYKQNEISITLWRNFAMEEFQPNEIVLFQNLIYKKNYNELTSCSQTTILRKSQLSELQKEINLFSNVSLKFNTAIAESQRACIFDINSILLSEEMSSKDQVFQLRCQFVDFLIGNVYRICKNCFGQVNAVDDNYVCQKDPNHFFKEPRVCLFARARIADFSGNLETILSDGVIDRMINLQNLAQPNAQQLLFLFEEQRYKQFIFELRIVKKKIKMSNCFVPDFWKENQYELSEILKSL